MQMNDTILAPMKNCTILTKTDNASITVIYRMVLIPSGLSRFEMENQGCIINCYQDCQIIGRESYELQAVMAHPVLKATLLQVVNISLGYSK